MCTLFSFRQFAGSCLLVLSGCSCIVVGQKCRNAKREFETFKTKFNTVKSGCIDTENHYRALANKFDQNSKYMQDLKTNLERIRNNKDILKDNFNKFILARKVGGRLVAGGEPLETVNALRDLLCCVENLKPLLEDLPVLFDNIKESIYAMKGNLNK